jgi:replication factor A1
MSVNNQNTPENGTDRASGSDDMNDIREMKEEVHRLSRDLGIPLEEAERSVYGNYGIDPPGEHRTITDLSEIEEGMYGITIRARLITVHRGERKDGKGEYFYGLMGDSSTTLRFSAWRTFDYTPGDALVIQNVSVRTFRDELEVVINEKSTISSTEEIEGLLPPVEDTVPGMIGELEPDARKVDIEGRIIDLNRGEVNVNDKPKEILRGTIADSSGRIDITCWDPLPLERGECYRVIGGYVKEYKGILRLNLDNGTIIKMVSDERLPSYEDLKAPMDVRIWELMRTRLGGQVRLRGTVLDVRSGSGIFRKCEECGRKLIKGQCTVHGKKKGEEDMAIRAVFDDGTGTCMLRGGRSLVESILGRPMEVISSEVREAMDPDMVAEELERALVAKTFTVTGVSIMDDYGMNLNVSGMESGWNRDLLKDEVSLLLGVVE